MKLRRILSGVLAATVAISSVAMSAFTSFAADTDNVELKFKQGNCTSDGGKMKYAVDGSWAPQKVMEADSLAYLKGGSAAIKTITGTVTVTGTVAEPFNMYVCYADGSGNAYWGEGNSANKKTTEESPLISEPGTYEVTLTLDEVTSPTAVNYIGFDGSANSFKNNPDAVVHADSLVINKTASSEDKNSVTIKDFVGDTTFTEGDGRYVGTGIIMLLVKYKSSYDESLNASIISDSDIAKIESLAPTLKKVRFTVEVTGTVDKEFTLVPCMSGGDWRVSVGSNRGGSYLDVNGADYAGVKISAPGTYDLEFTINEGKTTSASLILSSIIIKTVEYSSKTNNPDVTLKLKEMYLEGEASEAPAIDYTALDTAIADGEAVDTTKYTEETAKALTDAIAAAKAVKENTSATQDDVNAAAKAITDAIAALEEAPVEPVEIKWTGSFDRSSGLTTTDITGMTVTKGSGYMTFSGVDLSGMADPYVEVAYDANGSDDTLYVATSAWKTVIGSSTDALAKASLADVKSTTSFIVTTNNKSGSFGKITSVRFYDAATEPQKTVVAAYDISYIDSYGHAHDNNVTATVYSDNSMVISGTGATESVFLPGSRPWDSYPITSVTVEEGVTWLGCSMFEDMTDLKSVSLPDSLTRIDNGCFEGCTGLTDIVVPIGVVNMGSGSFRDCTSLKSATILGPISSWAANFWFDGCTALEEVSFSSGLKEIPDYTFQSCPNLKSVTIPDTVTSIGQYAFYNCSSLKSITLPNGLESIGTYAFNRAGLTSVTIPENVTTLSNGPFGYNKDLASVTISSKKLTEIPKSCFSDCTSLKEVNFPDSVTGMAIGLRAFYKCPALESVALPSGVTSIGESAFHGCTSLKSVTIPDSVTSIGVSAFLNDAALETCEISSSSKLETIGHHAFNSTGIKSIRIPAEVTSIDYFAFAFCPALESVTFEGNKLKTIEEYVFKECKALKSIEIPEGVTTIKTQAFNYCENMTSVKLPSTLKTIGNYAFLNEIRLSTIEIPESVTTLGEGAFDCCGLQGDITIPASITKIPKYAFKYCAFPSLNIHVEGAITEVGEDAFAECTGKIYVNDKNTYNLIKATDYGTAELIFAGAPDTTALDAAIAEAEAINTDIYTTDSVKALTDAVAAGNAAKENVDATQDDIDTATKNIKDAIKALVAGNVDEVKASLEALTQKIEKLLTVKSESDYTAESWTALDDALKAAKTALESDESLSYKEYKTLYENLSGAYTGLKTVSKSESEYLGTIYGGYEKTYNQETDSYKIVVSDDVDMKSVVGTTYVKVTCTPNKQIQYEIPYGKLHIWNFLDGDQGYTGLKGSEDNVFTYSLSIPNETSAFSLTGGTGWTKDKEVFYVKNVEFYNANDELLYTYTVDSIGEGDVRNLTTAIENAEALDKSKYTEETVALLELVLEEANATLSDTSATKADYTVQVSELEAAVNALVSLIDYTALDEAIADGEAVDTSLYTDDSVKTLTDAITAAKAVKENADATQDDVDNAVKAINDAIEALETKPVTGAVSGKIVVSDGNAETEMTVTATAADGTETSVTATSMGTYTIENLPVGDYTLTISGGKYVERTYEITVTEGSIDKEVNLNPLGDINGDGKVTTADVGMANSHAKGVKILEGYAFDCANVKNTDAEVTTADVGMINSHAKGVKTLW